MLSRSSSGSARVGVGRSVARAPPLQLLLQQLPSRRHLLCRPCRSVNNDDRSSGSAYDNPALYSSDDAFSERFYWDRRFESEALGHEWYRGYDSLRPLILE